MSGLNWYSKMDAQPTDHQSTEKNYDGLLLNCYKRLRNSNDKFHINVFSTFLGNNMCLFTAQVLVNFSPLW